ncbi:MAG: hypothetical protein HOW73_40775 [Polyangiaceae bacterium]|nr:hypothetical protein [Polyangiaceae bacterium]
MRPIALLLSAAALSAALLPARPASAGTFDAEGVFEPSDDAVDFEPFDEPERYVPDDDDATCQDVSFTVMEDPALALEGDSFVRVKVADDCAERFLVTVPDGEGSYSVSLWIRHGAAGARFIVKYPDEVGIPQLTARLSPTGRATSDGWIELASNELPIDTSLEPVVYVRFSDFASEEGVDLDALEVVPNGEYRDLPTCEGARDPVCGDDAVCIGGQCRLGNAAVPPLPSDDIKDEVVDALSHKIQTFFGGRKTRLADMPLALETVEAMRLAKSPWEFWNGWGLAVRQLHDWHTSARSPISEGSIRGRLNVCFIEGDADLSHDVLPSDPVYKDILVSHTGVGGTAGLKSGDRLVAIDGEHPIAWARKLIDVNWGYHAPCDAESFADFAEDLGGVGLILQYAKTISVIRCDGATDSCADTVETLTVSELPEEPGGFNVACDNRPSYHLSDTTVTEDHWVAYTMYRGRIANTAPEEQIFGMVWDTLYGGGDPNGYVNSTILNAVKEWKGEVAGIPAARGVILDHRAGNGGTIDSPEYLTQLVRPREELAILPPAILTAGFLGPDTDTEGVSLFNYLKNIDPPYTIGAQTYDANLPVALIIHRDGSASDYLPLGFKGSPKAKIFGPGPTAGAFSTFIQFSYWGGVAFQLASGDTITNKGASMIGHGVMPDVVVQQKQSDLVDGIDSIHEAALAWVRSELRP